jgi:hypothetical protein
MADSDAMNQSSSRVLAENRLTIAGGLLRGTRRLLWHAVRLPVLMLLTILEPVVRFILGALALLGVLTALFFRLYGVPHFPFAFMLGASVGFGLMLAGYYALLRVLDR